MYLLLLLQIKGQVDFYDSVPVWSISARTVRLSQKRTKKKKKKRQQMQLRTWKSGILMHSSRDYETRKKKSRIHFGVFKTPNQNHHITNHTKSEQYTQLSIPTKERRAGLLLHHSKETRNEHGLGVQHQKSKWNKIQGRILFCYKNYNHDLCIKIKRRVNYMNWSSP